LLDEVGIFSASGSIDENGYVVLGGDGAGFLDVGEGDRLSACGVVRDGDYDDANIFGLVFEDQFL
jgi:hypothetical protein